MTPIPPALFNSLESIGRYAAFALRALAALPSALARPGESARQFYATLTGALPLAAVAGVAVGVVLWMHLRGVLYRFVGPEAVQYLPTAIALAVTLEFAPLGAGLILAGRSGASLGAELGSMRLTEQIDALEVMGMSPMRQLVGPRVLAAMIALPLLTILMAHVAIGSSYLAEALGGTMSWAMYQNCILRGLINIQFKIVLSTLKTIVFGYLVAVTGCYCGMQATGGT